VPTSIRLGGSLLLVRHAMPDASADTPPGEWQLTEAGAAQAAGLRCRLPAGALLVASTEVKAIETIAAAHTDDRFDEVRRDEPFGGDFRARRRAYVAGAVPPGWEPHAEVAGRFDAGVRHWRTVAGDRPLVVASHGMAMTIWLTAAATVADPGAFWAALRFPDLLMVDLGESTVTRGYQAAGA
jgi:broad specificity phosphatase PhoE